MKFRDFLKDRLFYTIIYFGGISLAFIVMCLTIKISKVTIPAGSIIYVYGIAVVFYMIFMSYEFFKTKSFYNKLSEILNSEDAVEEAATIVNGRTIEQKLLVSVLQKMHREYKDEMYKAEDLEKNHSVFTSQWVHQMKTPVSVINLLLQEDCSAEDKELFKSIGEENERIEQGLNIMLYNSRINEFNHDFNVEEIDILSILRKVINDNKKILIRKRIFPEIIGESTLVQTDKKWMYFVISQLVINAVKYTSIAGREKEFGLLAMFGLTKSQIRRYVITENMIISVASVVTGLFFGMLFSKLFYMAVEAIIDLGGQVSFVISPKALIVTTISFLLVLNIISLMMSFKIKNSNIAELLKGSRVPKKNPKFSKFKAVLSILLIAGSYVAAVMSKAYIVFTMIPIFIVVVVGTRLLFTQFSVYFTDKLKNSRHVFYKGINMITLSQIIYKLKDNAKVMFITSILSGITLATAASVYSLQQVTLDGIRNNEPNDIAVMEQGVNSHNVIAEGKIDEILSRNKLEVINREKINLLKAENCDVKKNPNKKVHYSNNTILQQAAYYILRCLMKSRRINMISWNLTRLSVFRVLSCSSCQ